MTGRSVAGPVKRPAIKRTAWLALALVIVMAAAAVLSGCASKGSAVRQNGLAQRGAPGAGSTISAGGAPPTASTADSSAAQYAKASGSTTGAAPNSSVLGMPVSATTRKIIQNADLAFEVTDMTDALAKFDQAVAASGGYMSDSTVNGAKEGDQRAHLVARVPFSGFSEFMGRLDTLGTRTNRRIYTNDVTAEFIDLQARIATEQEHEARLRQILAQAKDLEDLIRLEQQLSQVRGEIESMTGRLNFLKDQVEMSTVTLDLVEVKPGETRVAPGTWQRARDAFLEMTRSLWQFSGAAVVAAAAALPLLLYVLVLGYLGWRLYRWLNPILSRRRPPTGPAA